MLFGVIFVVGFLIVVFVGSAIEDSNEKGKIESIETNGQLRSLDNKMSQLLKELSGWINNCKKCSGNEFRIQECSELQLTLKCINCSAKSTIKTNESFYKIEIIKEMLNHFKHVVDFMKNKGLDTAYSNYLANGIQKKSFDFVNTLENKYFFFKRLKKSVRYGEDIGQLKVYSEGSKIDQAKKLLETKKIEGLETRRKKLPPKIIQDWNYKRITSGTKGQIIKSWAKKSNLKCIDGSKCGGIKFSQIDDSEITFGHIIPQSWGKEYPHMLETIHHPDNLYLTCRSCNSSLNSGFPDPDLKNKISHHYGTIGDWLRNHLSELQD